MSEAHPHFCDCDDCLNGTDVPKAVATKVSSPKLVDADEWIPFSQWNHRGDRHRKALYRIGPSGLEVRV